MSEIMSIMLMLVVCVTGGLCATIWHAILKKEEKKGAYFELLIFYSILNMFALNLYRCYIWKADELICYSGIDVFLLIDLVLCMITSVLGPMISCVFMPKKIRCNKTKWQRASIVLCGISYCILGIERYVIYHNLKSAIYDLLLPRYIAIGVMGLLIAIFFVQIQAHKNVIIVDEACLAERLRKKIWNDVRNGKQRFQEAQLVILLFLMTIWIYPFWETILSNRSEWHFSLTSIIGYSTIVYLLCYCLLCLFFWFFRGKIWDMLLGIVFGSAVGAYIQAMFLNSNLFMLDGSKAQWNNSLLVCNLGIWIIIYVAIFVIYKLWFAYWKKMINFLAFVLVGMQLVALISLVPQYASTEENSKVLMEDYLSVDGMYEIGNEENVILFVLDCFDVDYMNEVLETEGDFLEPLEGFTYYPDTVSKYSRTWPSVTYMLTQEIYYRDISYQDYMNKAFSECDFWSELEQKGYQFSLYEEADAINLETRRKAKNFIEQGHSIEEQLSLEGCLHAIMNVGHYRTMPYLWKNYYLYTAEIINEYVIKTQIWDYPKYMADDAQIIAGLRENGLSVGENDKLFQFYHVTGAHPPYTLNEQGKRVKESETTPVEQYKGCMQFVFLYIEELKKLNLYENAMIIITTDHGENYMTNRLEENTNPILFIKPFGASSGELQVSNIFAEQGDILYTVAENLGLETSLEGIDLMDLSQDTSDRIRYHYYDVIDGTKQIGIAPYEIKGTSLDFTNWKDTGEYIEFLIP